MELKDSQRQLTIGSYVSVRSSRYEARGKFGEHERCVRAYASFVLSKLPACFISILIKDSEKMYEPIVL